MVISRLNAHDNWMDIKKSLDEYFGTSFLIDPFMVDKALLQKEDGKILEDLDSEGKWLSISHFHLTFELWDSKKHSIPDFEEGYGGCIKNSNLPLQYWNMKSFEAIGQHFGGLISVASKT